MHKCEYLAMTVEIVTPEATLLSGETSQVLVPGSKSPFAMRENHQAIVSSLTPGVVKITRPNGDEVRVRISGNSVVEQHANRVVIVAQEAEIAE